MAEEIARILRHKTDYYAVLGVQKTASEEEIKRAYKLRAVLVHPDKTKGIAGNNEAFQVLNQAKSTLLDAQKRRVYDRHGEEGVRHHESGGGGGGGGAAGGMHRQYYYRQQQQHFQNPFEEFFFAHHARRQGDQGRDGYQEVNLNLFMLAPVLLFLLLAMALQSSSFGDGGSGSSRSSNPYYPNSHKNLANAFSLYPNQDEGMTLMRLTAHPQFPEFEVKYYVSRQWSDLASRGYVDVRKTELEVLKKHRDSLGRRCESEVLRQRSKGHKVSSPQVCSEYDKIRERVRG